MTVTVGVACPADDCAQAFTSPTALAAHVIRHHAKEQDVFGCARCGTLYADADWAAECCEEGDE